MIRDETLRTCAKAKAKAKGGGATYTVWRMDRPQGFEARCIFFAHYICGTGRDDPLGDVYSQAPLNSVLGPALDAVSLAFTGMRCRDENMVRAAGRRYNDAIRSLRDALGTPKNALHDSTLQAVLLMDIYEKMSIPQAAPVSSPKLRVAHAKAALSLIRLRRKEDRVSANGRRLGSRVLSSLHINQGLLQQPMPHGTRELALELAAAAPAGELIWTCIGTMSNVLNFALITSNVNRSRNDDFLAQSLKLYARSVAATSRAAHLARHRTRREAPKGSMAYGGYYDVYNDRHAARLAGMFITMGLIPLSMVTTLYFAESQVLTFEDHVNNLLELESLVQDIIALAPEFVLPGLGPGNSIPFHSGQIIQCYPLLTFLWIAGSTTMNEHARLWIRTIFEYMAHEGGMEAAAHFELGRRQDSFSGAFFWRACTMPGSYSFVACGPGTCMEF